MVTGIRAALIELLPWYSGPAREAVATAKAAAESELTSRARQPRTSE